MNSPISPFIEQQGFVMLDGGLATELQKRGHNLNSKLWSAKMLINDHQEIQNVHLSYLEAGANCITTSTYQASLAGFMKYGISKKDATSLIKKAIEIANKAKDQYLNNRHFMTTPKMKPLIAASIGPYGAYLADGSEFRGEYSVSSQELRAFHESRLEIMCESQFDIFAFETIPSIQEAKVLLDLLESIPEAYAWISFSCRDGTRINDGTLLEECAEMFNTCDQIIAVGINCTAPRYISSLIREAQKGAPAKSVVVYPNSGETYNENQKSWMGSKDNINLNTSAIEWFHLGARLLGGCCRTNPGQITDMKKALLNSVHS